MLAARIGYNHLPNRNWSEPAPFVRNLNLEEVRMDGIIYLVGVIVIIMAILSFFGLR
jgi:hypothetical protein